MRKLPRALGVTAALAVLAVVPAGVAQEKKAKKKEPAAESKAGEVRINEGKDGKFRFTVYNAGGTLVAQSGLSGFATKEDAVKGVEALKETLATAKVVDGKKTEKEKDK